MTNCPSCRAEVPAGVRWCSICRSHTRTLGAGRLASPGKRLGAHCLDVVVWTFAYLSSVAIIAKDAFDQAMTGSEPAEPTTRAMVVVLVGLVLFLAVAIWSLVLLAKGTSPGKRLVGLRVVRQDGTSPGFFRMLIRETIGKGISTMILGLGFLWILIDQEHQGWHDKLMSTYVVE